MCDGPVVHLHPGDIGKAASYFVAGTGPTSTSDRSMVAECRHDWQSISGKQRGIANARLHNDNTNKKRFAFQALETTQGPSLERTLTRKRLGNSDWKPLSLSCPAAKNRPSQHGSLLSHRLLVIVAKLNSNMEKLFALIDHIQRHECHL